MAAITTNTPPTTAAVTPAVTTAPLRRADAEPVAAPQPRRPSHAARRVATALRGADGRLTVVCPA
jgi:hypothetical protein